MNFINDRELARRFKADAVPARERFYYFLILTMGMVTVTSSYVVDALHRPINQWDIAIDIAMIILAFGGSILLFKTNAKGDNKEFIERYVCLGFPIIIQTLLVMFVAFRHTGQLCSAY